jgi:hypothetical protein
MLYLKIDKVIYKEIPYNGEPLLPILQREGEQGWDFVEQFQTMKHNALALDPRQAMQLVITLCFKKYLYTDVPGFFVEKEFPISKTEIIHSSDENDKQQ